MQLFGDESGNPGDFNDRPDDRYFMVSTVTIEDVSWLPDLEQLAVSLRQRFNELGHEIVPREQQTPEALAAYHKAEIAKWWPIIKAANIKLE